MFGSYFPIPSSIGHSAGGSAFANALCTATCIIFGVKRLVSTPATSKRAASASPRRRRSHARSATQSTGFTARGARTLARSASRNAICAQREATGESIRRIRVDRKTPLAAPHGSAPRPSRSGSRLPTTPGSRRAQPGYSTGGGGGGRLRFATSSTAVSSDGVSPPASCVGVGCAVAGVTVLAGTWAGAAAGAGCGACCASTGSDSASAAEAISRGLMRIAALRNVNLHGPRRLFLRHCGEQN